LAARGQKGVEAGVAAGVATASRRARRRNQEGGVTRDEDLLLLVKSAGIGDGEPDLGEKLMVSFFRMLVESGRAPARAIFMNSGVFLTTRGSPVLEALRTLAAAGTEIVSCGTCLDYYKRADKLEIGAPSTMKETVAALLRYPRVVAP
jgi:selenium metabolism protein YedF